MPLDEDRRGHDRVRTRSIACSSPTPTSSPSARVSGDRRRRTAFVQALVERTRRAARPRRRRAERVRRRRRSARRPRRRRHRHHAASGRDGAALGLSIEDVQAHRLDVARDFAATHRAARRAEGASHDHRDARRQDVHQSHRQSRHGDRRHRRRAHRHDRRLARRSCSTPRPRAKLAVYLHGLRRRSRGGRRRRSRR